MTTAAAMRTWTAAQTLKALSPEGATPPESWADLGAHIGGHWMADACRYLAEWIEARDWEPRKGRPMPPGVKALYGRLIGVVFEYLDADGCVIEGMAEARLAEGLEWVHGHWLDLAEDAESAGRPWPARPLAPMVRAWCTRPRPVDPVKLTPTQPGLFPVGLYNVTAEDQSASRTLALRLFVESLLMVDVADRGGRPRGHARQGPRPGRAHLSQHRGAPPWWGLATVPPQARG